MVASTSTTVREPEFDQFDREHFEALADLKADTCPGCGGLLSETTANDGHGYDIEHTTCFRCAALAMQQHEFDKATEDAPKGHHGWHLDPDGNPVVPSAQLWTARHLPPPD